MSEIDDATRRLLDYGLEFDDYSNPISSSGFNDKLLASGGIASPASSLITQSVTKNTPWYGDDLKGVLGAGAGFASGLASLFALPGQIKLAKTQTDALKQNIAFAGQEQQRRNKNIDGYNNFKHNAPTSTINNSSIA